MPLAAPTVTLHWIAAMRLLALVAVVFLALADPSAIRMPPLVAVVLVGIRVVRAREARRGLREEERSRRRVAPDETRALEPAPPAA